LVSTAVSSLIELILTILATTQVSWIYINQSQKE
jgi:hypothetical protein